MLVHRLRRPPSIGPTLGRYVVLVGIMKIWLVIFLSDINECDVTADLCSCADTLPTSSGCQADCLNTNGSFQCLCSHWFYLPEGENTVCGGIHNIFYFFKINNPMHFRDQKRIITKILINKYIYSAVNIMRS